MFSWFVCEETSLRVEGILFPYGLHVFPNSFDINVKSLPSTSRSLFTSAMGFHLALPKYDPKAFEAIAISFPSTVLSPFMSPNIVIRI